MVLPQALRVIVPPMTSQYLNLTKNSSLAVAIGYPDLVSIANTTINQTGQAIEGIAIIMAVYLTISLSISAFMNWYNARMCCDELAEQNLFAVDTQRVHAGAAVPAVERPCRRSSTGRSSTRSGARTPRPAATREGACWGFIAEKHRFILFGTYPYEQHWRPALASVLLIGLWVLLGDPRCSGSGG